MTSDWSSGPSRLRNLPFRDVVRYLLEETGDEMLQTSSRKRPGLTAMRNRNRSAR
jgi:hypothetical protein